MKCVNVMELSKTTTINTQAPISYNGGLLKSLKQFFETRKAVNALNAMSDAQLMDIGVTRCDIKAAVSGDMYR